MGETSFVVGAGSSGLEAMTSVSAFVTTAGCGVGLAVWVLRVLAAATGAGVGVETGAAAIGGGTLALFFDVGAEVDVAAVVFAFFVAGAGVRDAAATEVPVSLEDLPA